MAEKRAGWTPEWYHFRVKAAAKYLGIWMGPAAGTFQWHDQVAKHRLRVSGLAAQELSVRDALHFYNTRCATVLSYVAQFKRPPVTLKKIELACLCKTLKIPGQAFSRGDLYNFEAFACAKVVSVDALCLAAMARTATKTIKQWWGLLRELQVSCADALPMRQVIAGNFRHAIWDEDPIVQSFYAATRLAVEHGLCDPLPTLVPSNANPFSLPRLDMDSEVPTGEVQQKDMYLTIYNKQASNGTEGWKAFFRKRLVGAFGVPSQDVETIDFDPIFVLLREFPKHVSFVWIKTMANAWCTSSRMHERPSLSCVFGCSEHEDSLKHYILCPVLLRFGLAALRVSPAEALRVRQTTLSSLGLQPVNPICIFNMYVLFALYHDRKNSCTSHLDSNVEHMQVPFTSDNARHTKAYADAMVKKLEGMRGISCTNAEFASSRAGRSSYRSGMLARAAPAFVQGLDPWIGAAHSR